MSSTSTSNYPSLASHPPAQEPHAPGPHSYAAVAAHNAPPPSQQPHPDLGLLNTANPEHPLPDVDTGKVNVVSHDWKQHPETQTSTLEILATDDETSSDEEEEVHKNVPGSQKRKARNNKQKKAKKEAAGTYDLVTQKLFQPAVAGGLFSILNIGILGAVGYTLYTKPHTRTSPKFLGLSGAGLLAVFGIEGYAAEKYLETPEGRREKKRAKKEGAAIYRHTKEVVLRPGVFGGLFGAINLAVLGGLGYFTYTHWEHPGVWTRKNLSIGTIGLITWISSQGYIAEKYRQEEYYKRK